MSTSTLDQLKEAARHIANTEFQQLASRYGTTGHFVNGWAYHNATHARDVAAGGERGARSLVATGELPPETVPLARIAGAFHDDIQVEQGGTGLSPRREELSVKAAFAAMNDYETRTGERVFTDKHRDTVGEMIMATKATGVHNGDIVQNVSPGSTAGALLADADLSGLGLAKGLHQAVLLHAEQEHLAGRLHVPKYSNGLDLRPDPDRITGALQFQVRLHGTHKYHLGQSPKLFAQQALNTERVASLLERHQRGDLSWRNMLRQTREWATPHRNGRSSTRTGTRRRNRERDGRSTGAPPRHDKPSR